MNPNALAVKKAKDQALGLVTSESKGRLRLSIQEKRRDKLYFERLIQSLEGRPGVIKAKANPMTGSLLIYSNLRKDDLIKLVEKTGLLTVSPSYRKSPAPVKEPAPPRPRHPSTGGGSELSALAGMTLLGLAAWQGTRGKFLPAGLTLIFQASEFLKSWHLRPTTSQYEPLSEGL